VPTAQNGKKENLLTSWKEIAAYLDRDVRTCIRWEKALGLPVHRLEPDSKAKVFAYKDEVDRWIQARSGPGSPPRGPIPAMKPGGLLFVIPALFVLAAAAYFLVPGFKKDAVPADFHIRESVLVVTNARGAELWHYDTGLADLEGETFYREHFQDKKRGLDYVPVWPCISFKDINRDGRIETLFSTQTRSEVGEGLLLCFDAKGHELWRFAAGRELAFGGKIHRREYRIFGFDVTDYNGDGKLEVLVLSFHKPDWPCQVALLDAAGSLAGEYWNSGYLMDAVSGDIDGDGVKEMALSGVNNEYRRGCVVIFRAGDVQGCSPQTDDAYRSPALLPGRQTAYILFPNPDFHHLLGQQGDAVNYLWVHDGGGITGMTNDTQIFFDLNRRLECTSATLSHYARNIYARLAEEGRVRGPLDKDWEQRLTGDFLYYVQGRWVKKAPALDK
jgi:hypothetical protein